MREYSIPHLRQAGRISIPEDSFDRIREARDLHKEGLGTETVRRQLRQGGAPDSGELDRRLDTLHRTVEDLREDVSYSPTQRTILARQSLLMSAVFNLTEMVEELLLASGKRRKRIYQDIEAKEAPPERQVRARLSAPGDVASGEEKVPTAYDHNVGVPRAFRPTDFGALRRRRRRGVLTILVALALAACIAWATIALPGINNAESPVPRVTEMAAEPPAAPDHQSTIPDVSGQTLEKAVKTISGAGFEVVAIESSTSPQTPETALRTNPAAGVTAKPGAPVTLTLSAGPATSASTATATATATASPTAANTN